MYQYYTHNEYEVVDEQVAVAVAVTVDVVVVDEVLVKM